MDNWLGQLNLTLPLVAVLTISIAAVVHALLFKRDSRAAFGWIAVCILFPLAGPILYYVFGINRVRIRARRLEQSSIFSLGQRGAGVDSNRADVLQVVPDELESLVTAADALAAVPLVAGNHVQMLHNGEQAYPQMLAAIDRAKRFVYLSTYIFDSDGTGRRFVDALARATERGVDVRVLLDGIGEYYAWPRRRVSGLLRRRGVRVARFLAPRLLPPSLRLNLRNHRKILAVDGEIAFTGGMNIGDRHLAVRGRRRVVDLHFALRGPVVEQIEEIFLNDWAFVTGQSTEPLPASTARAGTAAARAVDDGPTEDTDRLALLLIAAVASARRRILIMTPYFLPSPALIGALQGAALRGLDVVVVLPEKNNLPYMHWAIRHGLYELLARGVKVYYQPPPFTHSKLFVVDDAYAVIGSANIDPRSLRLNFELAVEVYDRNVVVGLADHIVDAVRHSRRYTQADLDARALPVRLRDAFAWLFTPYL